MKKFLKTILLSGLGLGVLASCGVENTSTSTTKNDKIAESSESTSQAPTILNVDFDIKKMPLGDTLTNLLLNNYSVTIDRGQFSASNLLVKKLNKSAGVAFVATIKKGKEVAYVAYTNNEESANKYLELYSIKGYNQKVNGNVAMYYNSDFNYSMLDESIIVDKEVENLGINLSNYVLTGNLREYSNVSIESYVNPYEIQQAISIGKNGSNGYALRFESSAKANEFFEYAKTLEKYELSTEGEKPKKITIDTRHVKVEGCVVYCLTPVAYDDMFTLVK